MQGPEKNSYNEFDNEKKFLRLETPPPPPYNFSNGPSLLRSLALGQQIKVIINTVTSIYPLGLHPAFSDDKNSNNDDDNDNDIDWTRENKHLALSRTKGLRGFNPLLEPQNL